MMPYSVVELLRHQHDLVDDDAALPSDVFVARALAALASCCEPLAVRKTRESETTVRAVFEVGSAAPRRRSMLLPMASAALRLCPRVKLCVGEQWSSQKSKASATRVTRASGRSQRRRRLG